LLLAALRHYDYYELPQQNLVMIQSFDKIITFTIQAIRKHQLKIESDFF